MNEPLNVETIRKIVAKLKTMQVPHKTFATQKEVDEQNAMEKSIGLPGDWKVGDTYYNITDIFRPKKIREAK